MDEKRMQNYKKYTLALLFVTVAALIVCAAAFSFKRSGPAGAAMPQAVATEHYTPNQAASQESSASQAAAQAVQRSAPALQPSAPAESYLVSIYNGKISVFQSGRADPILVCEGEAYLLPQEDIDLLRKGIPASTMAEVRSILEDYDQRDVGSMPRSRATR